MFFDRKKHHATAHASPRNHHNFTTINHHKNTLKSQNPL
jgi:hypothetical protein